MYTKVARMFNCSWEQIKNIIANSDAIMEFYDATKNHKDLSRDSDDHPQELDQIQKKIKFLGECLYEYIQRVQLYEKIPITEDLIRVKAMEFQEILKLDNFTCSKHWINHFKASYNIALSNKQIVLTRVPPASLELKDIMTYCSKQRIASIHTHMKDLKQKYNSLDDKTAEYESRRIRKLNFLQRALSEYLHRAKFHHKALKLDDESVQKVAESFNDILKVQDFYPTLEWIRNFKLDHSMMEAKQGGGGDKKRPLLSLDLKDILSYCGRKDNNTVTLTPKHSSGPTKLKFQKKSIIYLDEGDEAGEGEREFKPNLEKITVKRKEERETPPPPPLKIRKIESINNDPILQRELQQEKQQMQNYTLPEEKQTAEVILPEATKDETVYVKQEIYIKPEPDPEPQEMETEIQYNLITEEARRASSLMSRGEKITNNTPTNHSTPMIGNMNQKTLNAGASDTLWQVTCFEDALRFLKPLEEYAMLAENYRAIGLISQLEEVLKQQKS